ncbi:MAG: hypothetical protein LBQ87_00245 [Candidatus Fibromonas sp.]|nr:hypothetical protein [Candidatus Fibromonas sp.]
MRIVFLVAVFFAAFQPVFAAVTTKEFCKQKQIDKELEITSCSTRKI